MLFSLLQYFKSYKGGIVHNSKLKQITIALCMALMPVAVFAAGLGKLNVISGLGEPLKADIELLSVTPEELSTITAAIATEEAYATQGIERPASHGTIKVEVAKSANGTPILKLKSSQPISEPFLDMLIQVDWASGRLLREYTVLLDPPGYTGESDPNNLDTKANQSTQAPVVKSSNASALAQDEKMAERKIANMPSGSKKSNKRAKAAKNDADTESAAPSTDNSQDYVTQRGDTLAKVAQDMKPEGISLEQMLVGLYQANPNAFDGDNMNRLKVGKILRQPSEDALNAVSRKEASKEIKVQTANWNAYRNKLAGIVADSTPADTESNAQSAGGKIKTAAEDKSLPVTSGSKDVVKLSAGESSAAKGDSANTKSLQDKITALQEEATAREKSVKEAQDKTAALEKQINDMQKLLALKSGAMSDLQKQAETKELAKPAEIAKPAETVKPAEAAKPAETAKPGEAVKPAEVTKPADAVLAKPDAPAVAEKPVIKPIVKPVIAPVAPPPVEAPGFLANLVDGLDLTMLGGAAGLLALLGGGWMYLRKKRERSLADFEQGIMTSGGLKANTVFGNTSTGSVDTGDTSFLTDFSQSANGGMIDTNDVDPIAEAEVYMAYGRDAQAEEILKDAISKEPKRYELHLKLLEMYAASKNLSAFETISGELYTTLGAEDPTWAKVAEIGIKLEPNNPLYQVNVSPVASMASNKTLDATDFSDSPMATDNDLDFSLDNASLTQDFASTSTNAADAFDLDLGNDLGKLETDTAAEFKSDYVDLSQDTAQADDMLLSMNAPSTAPVTLVDDNAGLDFDMGELNAAFAQSPTLEAEQQPVHLAEAEFGHTMPGLDIPTFEMPNYMPELATDASVIMPDTVTETATDSTVSTESFETFTQDAFELPHLESANQMDEAMNVTDNAETFSVTEVNADVESADINDFNFDFSDTTLASDDSASLALDAGITESPVLNAADIEAANTFDLSGITLDLDDSTASSNAFAASTDEPIEVETKLDLVQAYIEMDDKEGAKELLDEVMKEGGANQRKRAQELLVKLA